MFTLINILLAVFFLLYLSSSISIEITNLFMKGTELRAVVIVVVVVLVLRWPHESIYKWLAKWNALLTVYIFKQSWHVILNIWHVGMEWERKTETKENDIKRGRCGMAYGGDGQKWKNCVHNLQLPVLSMRTYTKIHFNYTRLSFGFSS